MAIDSGHQAMAQFLIDNGADVNQHGAPHVEYRNVSTVTCPRSELSDISLPC